MSRYCQVWSLRSQCQFNGECEPCPYKWPHVPRCSKCGKYHRMPTEKCSSDYRRINREYVQGFLRCQIEVLKTIEDNLDKLTAGEIITVIRTLVPK